jgi:PqqD family protein of HPr-rel-A system
MKWRIESPGRFYDAGERAVVYFDTASGDTHLLSDFAAYILEQFEGRPLSVAELASLAEQAVEPGDRQDLEAMITGVLEELVALDILKQDQRAECDASAN